MVLKLEGLWPPVTINDPTTLWADHPSFVAQECFFIIAATAVWLAHRQNDAPRNRVLFWTVVFGGNLIEILTGLESEIGCFWESQAVAMVLGGRFPFYCVWGMYVFMGYLPTALAMACDLDALGEAGLAALIGGFLYQTFGILGNKHLWWVFHVDERLFDDRWFGDPAAHPFWMTATAWSIPLAVRAFAPDDRVGHGAVLLRSFACAVVAYLVLINVPFLAFYYPMYFNGVSGYWALHFFRAACALCVWRGRRRAAPPPAKKAKRSKAPASLDQSVVVAGFAADRHRNGALALSWLGVVLALSSSCDPAQVRRTGFGQFVMCNSGTETSFWGLFVREAGLCPRDVRPEEHNFRVCDDETPPADGREWYTLCGAAMDEGTHAWLALHAFLAAATVLYAVSRAKDAAKLE